MISRYPLLLSVPSPPLPPFLFFSVVLKSREVDFVFPGCFFRILFGVNYV